LLTRTFDGWNGSGVTTTPGTASGTSTVPGLTQITLKKVITPTGGEIEVMGDAEERRYNESLAQYTQGVTFTERSDLEDLERILFMELMNYRWSRWLAAGREYDGTIVNNEGELRRWINDYNTAITKIKESLKLDRKGREGDQAMTFDARWRRLAEHAQEMGIMREKQLGRALEIMQGLFGIVATFDRSDAEERGKIGFPDEASIVQYVRESRPAFDEIDEYFREHQQRLWVRNP